MRLLDQFYSSFIHFHMTKWTFRKRNPVTKINFSPLSGTPKAGRMNPPILFYCFAIKEDNWMKYSKKLKTVWYNEWYMHRSVSTPYSPFDLGHCWVYKHHRMQEKDAHKSFGHIFSLINLPLAFSIIFRLINPMMDPSESRELFRPTGFSPEGPKWRYWEN